MKNFKEMLDKDLDRTFYNTEEFAELQRVRIDGVDRNIPVIFDSDAAEARRQMLSGDHAQGIYQKLLVVRIRLSDLEKEPRQGMRMWIGNELYKISEVTTEYKQRIRRWKGRGTLPDTHNGRYSQRILRSIPTPRIQGERYKRNINRRTE